MWIPHEPLFLRHLPVIALTLALCQACTTLPQTSHEKYDFPKESAYIHKPKRDFDVVGEVRSKVNYPTLDMEYESDSLCRNYYNKSVFELVEYAKRNGGDAVMEVRSITLYLDGKAQLSAKPECYDDGSEGQVLTRGIAIKWKK